jgi:hypothetical protein
MMYNNIMKYLSILLLAIFLPILAQAQGVPEAGLPSVEAGSLIRAEGSTAVYYLADDGKRYVFPNEKTYKTWYKDFSSVQVITLAQLQNYQIGGNVTYRPGTRLVKITTDPKTYAVEPGGVLRWITSEDVAQGLYGDNWAQKIDDVPDPFFVNYQSDGAIIESLKHPIGSLISLDSENYLVTKENDLLVKRKISNLADNNYRAEFVLGLHQSIFYEDGTEVTSREESLVNLVTDRLDEPVVVPTPTPLPPVVDLAPNSLFVDNRVATSGDGSQDKPFQNIATGISALTPGQTLYIRGTPDATGLLYSEEISFTNGGSASNPKILAGYPGEKVIINPKQTVELNYDWVNLENLEFDYKIGTVNIMEISGENITLDNIAIHNTLAKGLVFEPGAKNITVKNSKIYDFLDDCIYVGLNTENITIDNSEIYDCFDDAIEVHGDEGTALSEYPHMIDITNNEIYTTLAEFSVMGINITGGDDVLIQGNDIYGFTSSQAILVLRGSLNIDIVGNQIHDSSQGIEVRATTLTPRNIDVFNNLIYNITGTHALKLDGVIELRVVHNTLYNITSSPFWIQSQGISSGQIRNNLISQAGPNKKDVVAFFASVSHNGWFDGASSVLIGGSSNTEGTDPKFVASANGDFSLGANSPAIDAGTEVTFILTDFAGNPRVVGVEPDLGAYEVQ